MNYRLAEQITFLLLRHHYVVVPQLGGFIREVLPASYNADKAIAYHHRQSYTSTKSSRIAMDYWRNAMPCSSDSPYVEPV